MNLGYLGLFLGTFAAGTILTFSSDVVLVAMLMAGGDPWLCLIFATAGNGSGALVSYVMGWFAKWEWIEKWFRVSREKLESQKARVMKWGMWSAFFSWIPVVGPVLMIALGLYKVRPLAVSLITYAGCLFRFSVWVLLYVHFGDQFVEWLGVVVS